MLQAVPSTRELEDVVDTTHRMRAAVEGVVTGRPELVRVTVAVLLAEGHLLLEDVPGVGKTTLAKALARTIDCTVGRIQFTPDLLPSDLTGVNIFRSQTHEFEFRPGPVFAHVVIGDEINRASPKTQSALLECMQEAQATVDGRTYPLPRPFLVVATQNPVEMEGTYPLPEAQRDRFMARLTVGYPSIESELDMLDLQETSDSTSSTVTPRDLIFRMASNSVATTAGASPSDGSSSIRSLGSAISPRPMASICCWPPLSTPARLGVAPSAPGNSSNTPSMRSPCCFAQPLRIAAELEIFLHGHLRENVAAFRDMRQSELRKLVRFKSRDILSGEKDAPGRDVDQPRNRPQQRGLADAVPAEQRDDLAWADIERAIPDHLDVAVADIDVLHRQQVQTSWPRPFLPK